MLCHEDERARVLEDLRRCQIELCRERDLSELTRREIFGYLQTLALFVERESAKDLHKEESNG
jgi:hypothetical protein